MARGGFGLCVRFVGWFNFLIFLKVGCFFTPREVVRERFVGYRILWVLWSGCRKSPMRGGMVVR